MGKICELFIGFFFLYVAVECQQTAIPELTVKAVSRAIDISSQLCKVSLKIQIENTGKTAVSYFVFSLEQDLKPRLSFISAHGSDKSTLKVTAINVAGKPHDGFWKIDLKDQLQSGKLSSLEIDYVLTDALTPYPTMISQKEKQLVRYNGNHYVYLPYNVLKQTTALNLGTKSIENYSKLAPVAIADTTISYGPYNQISAYSFDPMLVHYENNAPFVKVTKLQRTLEVSHWGNVAVEEIVDLLHTGAKLKGPFSRYDFQREAGSGASSVKSFKTVLPASATDVYYRDDIGNISTSHMRLLGDSVELDLRPRFPLFGGWKTHYVLGYNVPSYEYLYNSGDLYKLKMRVMDHVFDDMDVEELITKIILPEGAEEILLTTPYPMTRLPNTRHSTYLDTKGRPVITVTKRNLVENHIQTFELDYAFPKSLMLQEPLLVAIFFYLLFLLVIIYVRLDFSISKDEASEVKLRVSGSLDKLLQHLDNRANTYNELDEQLAKVKASKDVASFNAQAKTIQGEYKNETNQISELALKMKPDSPDIYNKLQEIQKLDKSLKDLYNQKQNLCTEKRITGKVGREAFLEAEATLNKKRDEIIEKINAIVKTIH